MSYSSSSSSASIHAIRILWHLDISDVSYCARRERVTFPNDDLVVIAVNQRRSKSTDRVFIKIFTQRLPRTISTVKTKSLLRKRTASYSFALFTRRACDTSGGVTFRTTFQHFPPQRQDTSICDYKRRSV